MLTANAEITLFFLIQDLVEGCTTDRRGTWSITLDQGNKGWVYLETGRRLSEVYICVHSRYADSYHYYELPCWGRNLDEATQGVLAFVVQQILTL